MAIDLDKGLFEEVDVPGRPRHHAAHSENLRLPQIGDLVLRVRDRFERAEGDREGHQAAHAGQGGHCRPREARAGPLGAQARPQRRQEQGDARDRQGGGPNQRGFLRQVGQGSPGARTIAGFGQQLGRRAARDAPPAEHAALGAQHDCVARALRPQHERGGAAPAHESARSTLPGRSAAGAA